MQFTSLALLCLTAASVGADGDSPWWRNANLYQIYPRSFQDSTGDGIGDIKGITQRASYFKDLGVDAVWVSPVFKSPMVDLGYDISDYLAIDPLFGTNDDIKELFQKLQSWGIKCLLDLVPNHTSDEHEWFKKSVKREDPYTDYYVWVDGKTNETTGEKMPPNNWVSTSSFPAWQWNEERQQFYLHQFLTQQPDLNFRYQKVVEELEAVIMFWLNMGVDGFRVDAPHFMFEDKLLRDNPVTNGIVGTTYTRNQPETYQLLHHWVDIVYEYSQKDGKDRALFLEIYGELNTTLAYYGTGNESLMQPFNFGLLMGGSQNTRPADFREMILDWINNMPSGASANWVTGNHDRVRASDRYGAGKVDAMNILTGVLPGCKGTYYGEEIGMHDVFVSWEQTVDNLEKVQGPDHYQEKTRDPVRTPMQWDDSDNAGFSTNSSTWLPLSPDYRDVNVAKQNDAKTSHLKVYKAMAEARKDPVLRLGDTDVRVHKEDTLLVVRTYKEERYVLIVNLGNITDVYTSENLFGPNGIDDYYTIVTSSVDSGLKAQSLIFKTFAGIKLGPDMAVLLRTLKSHGTSISRSHFDTKIIVFQVFCFLTLIF